MNSSPRRLRSETSEVKLQWHDDAGKWCEEDMAVCIAVDERGAVWELNFVMRPGRQGATLDQMFSNLGIQLSRVIQGRNPETGDAL